MWSESGPVPGYPSVDSTIIPYLLEPSEAVELPRPFSKILHTRRPEPWSCDVTPLPDTPHAEAKTVELQLSVHSKY